MVLTADLGPAERYRRWLAVRRGAVRVVVGTRSAAFAPVAAPGLLVVWDDGDDLHAEPRAPYPHVRDVLVLRAHAVGAALLVAGYARTAEGQLLVESGWASEIVADRATVRAAMPRVVAQGESDLQLARDPLARAARLPSAAFEAARAALAAGRPVLVQTPRAGYVPWLSCASCRETARCRRCAGPLGVPGRGVDATGPAARRAGPAAEQAGDRGVDRVISAGDRRARPCRGAGGRSRRRPRDQRGRPSGRPCRGAGGRSRRRPRDQRGRPSGRPCRGAGGRPRRRPRDQRGRPSERPCRRAGGRPASTAHPTRRPRRRLPVAGAVASRAPTGAAPAAHAGCARASSAPGAPRRSSGGRSPASRSASPAAARPC